MDNRNQGGRGEICFYKWCYGDGVEVEFAGGQESSVMTAMDSKKDQMRAAVMEKRRAI